LTKEIVKSICKELELQKNYLGNASVIKTVYFGGGTPSILSIEQIAEIMDTVRQHYLLDLQELTIETNPDDLTPEKLIAWKDIGFDRLSIGIQSFNERVLRFYNRAHNAQESLIAVERAKQAGFEKLSIDLMYGFPHHNHEIWNKDLDTALKLDPGHISSYALTIEADTALGKWTEKGKFIPASEDFVAEQFEWMQETLDQAGYVQYEISNFGKPGAFAVHNTNYWMGIPYLGVGPSAHSFNGKSRQHNPSNNIKYIKSLEQGLLSFDYEEIDLSEALNEYLLTSLRTIWGADVLFILDKFQKNLLIEKDKEIGQLIKEDLLKVEGSKILLTRKGKLLADGIALKLFL